MSDCRNCTKKYLSDSSNPVHRKKFLGFAGKLALITPVALAMNKQIEALSVHSNLKRPEDIKRFKHISSELTCTCGKNIPILHINDLGHCNTWPMRQVIDRLIEDGKSDEFILNGFVNGFKELVKSHRAFELVRSTEYQYLIPGMTNGFGESILAEPSEAEPAIAAAVAGAGIAAAAIMFIKKRHKNLKKSSDSQASTLSSEKEQEMMNRLYDDE